MANSSLDVVIKIFLSKKVHILFAGKIASETGKIQKRECQFYCFNTPLEATQRLYNSF